MNDFFKRFFGTSQRERDAASAMAADSDSQESYVASQLELAQQQAASLPIGESFTYRLTDIPTKISSPHEIIFGMMMLARQYGLQAGSMINEEIDFTRVS